MDIRLQPGRYVIAVSGGVDSVALLHLLRDKPEVELIVAHFDHGIRNDSQEDRRLVQSLAERYGLPFVYAEGRLGADVSEAVARDARYEFLRKVMREHQARAIITAHHQDDAVETAIINLLRGTRRKGLSALGSRDDLERPLLHASKQDVLTYAGEHGLVWREDSTNRQETYLRNYIRHRIVPKFEPQDRQKLIAIIDQSRTANRQLDALLAEELKQHTKDDALDRAWFVGLPHDVAKEVMAAWLRHSTAGGFSRRTLERLVVAAKVSPPGHTFDVVNGVTMTVGKDNLALSSLER